MWRHDVIAEHVEPEASSVEAEYYGKEGEERKAASAMDLIQ